MIHFTRSGDTARWIWTVRLRSRARRPISITKGSEAFISTRML
jgi:hypothetical protein